MTKLPNERIDEVNDKLKLIQRTDGLTFGTDALLLAGYVSGKYKRGVELGGGSGIISMLLLTRNKAERIECCEVQDYYADLIRRNAEFNGLEDRLEARLTDIRDLPANEDADLVFTNPPYMKADGGKNNDTDEKAIARHEIHGSIKDFLLAAKRQLKYGGAFYAVYRPDRLIDLTVAMREAGLEPKRATFVHASLGKEAAMVLIEGKRGARSGMILTKPFIIYKTDEHKEYTDDMEYVMETAPSQIHSSADEAERITIWKTTKKTSLSLLRFILSEHR
jgi:tRNA1(Val) A37 N6-methylase TrmN6